MSNNELLSIEYITADEYFHANDKKLFLKIPHTITHYEKYNLIDFNVPENGRYSTLSRITIAELLDNFTSEELKNKKILKDLPYSATWEKAPLGFYINSNHGSHCFSLMQELYKYDPKNAQELLNEYYSLSLNSKEIKSINTKIIQQICLMKDYLKKEKIIFTDYKIDYNKLVSLDEKSLDKEIDKLFHKYGMQKSLPAYNDLDYTPLMIDDEYHIYDSSGARLWIIREKDNIQKIYQIDMDKRDTILDQIGDMISEFAYEHHQREVVLSNTITETDLIGEIQDGVLTKATVSLVNFDLIQSFIVKDLIKNGKIAHKIEELSFKDLLKNYTLQNEFYRIEERAIVPLLKDLQIINGQVTYDDFNLMDLNQTTKHEKITDFTLRELKDNISSLNDLDQLPPTFSSQISEYLHELMSINKNKYVEDFCNLIQQKIDGEVVFRKINTNKNKP